MNFCETTDLPVIAMGDFNFSVNTSTYRYYIAPYFNLFDPALWPDKESGSGYLGTFGSSKIDYVIGYPKGTWTPISYTVDRSAGRLSDHYPIIVTLELN